MPVYQLPQQPIFPNPTEAEEDGLLAVGGDLHPKRLIEAYKQGIFPWYNEDDPILWYCPHNRFVLFPQKFKASKSLKKLYNSDIYTFTINHSFEAVIEHCSSVKRKNQNGTWIHNEMKLAYTELYKLGYALSVEVWNKKQHLVGGIYGVKLNQFYAGESMFSIEPNTSKLALYHFVQQNICSIIDCQFHTPHLESLGAEEIPYTMYINALKNAIEV